MIFEYLQLVLKPVLGFIVSLAPQYYLFILGGVSVLLAYLYFKVDMRNFFSTVNKGFIAVFGLIIFLLLEAMLK